METIKSKYSWKLFFLYPILFFLNLVLLCGLIYNLVNYTGIVFKDYFEKESYDLIAIVFFICLSLSIPYYLISNCKSIEISDIEIKINNLLNESFILAKSDVIIHEGHDNIKHNPHTKTFTVVSKQTKKKIKFREFEYKNYDRLLTFLSTKGYEFYKY